MKLNSAHRAMLLITTLLALPFVLAWALYAYGWRPETSGNYGELLQPPTQLPVSELRLADGKALPRAQLLGTWQFVLIAPTPCGEPCLYALHQMRQVHVSLNKGMPRLKRLWITPGSVSDPGIAEVRSRWPDLQIAQTPADPAWQTAFPTPDRVYVIDPLGNVIMRYPADPDWNLVRKDIERLLKYSWTG